MKKYIEYIKENINERFIDLLDIFNNNHDIESTQKELEELLLNNMCFWYTKNREYKEEKIKSCKIEINNHGGVNFYLNGFSADPDFSVEIKRDIISENKKHEVIGLPSGEILYLNKDDILTLFDFKLINYETKLSWDGFILEKVFFFHDRDYHAIKKIIDPLYEKPLKYNNDDNYKKGDIIICKGMSGTINIQNKIGKVVLTMNNRYLIEFLTEFESKYKSVLLNGNKLWLTKNNIKGFYNETEKIENEINNLEDHEIDDNYHIKQLFNNKKDDNFKIGDIIFLKNKNKALYLISDKEFSDVWFNIGERLGKIIEIKEFKGEICFKPDIKPGWYRMKCVSK